MVDRCGVRPVGGLGVSAKFGLVALGIYLLSGALCTLAALGINRAIERATSNRQLAVQQKPGAQRRALLMEWGMKTPQLPQRVDRGPPRGAPLVARR